MSYGEICLRLSCARLWSFEIEYLPIWYVFRYSEHILTDWVHKKSILLKLTLSQIESESQILMSYGEICLRLSCARLWSFEIEYLSIWFVFRYSEHILTDWVHKKPFLLKLTMSLKVSVRHFPYDDNTWKSRESNFVVKILVVEL